MGKLAAKELQKLLKCIKKDKRVIVPPLPGYDSGVHLIDDKYMVVAADPCTGVPEEWFGWLLINYAASDVALFGAKPQFCTVTLLGPRFTKPSTFQTIMEQTCKAADELNVAIVRGHTGTYDRLSGIIGVCTAYGSISHEKLKTPANAKPGDLILCTKPLGLETIMNFSLAYPSLAQQLFGKEKQRKLSKQLRLQSCVHEALQLAEIRGVEAMHDATEGGFAAALNELADASKVGFKVEWEKVPISNEALVLRDYFKFTDNQLLSMSSTGTILAAVNPKAQQQVKDALGNMGLTAYFLGKFTDQKKRVITKEEKETPFPQTPDDPYTLVLSGK